MERGMLLWGDFAPHELRAFLEDEREPTFAAGKVRRARRHQVVIRLHVVEELGLFSVELAHWIVEFSGFCRDAGSVGVKFCFLLVIRRNIRDAHWVHSSAFFALFEAM